MAATRRAATIVCGLLILTLAACGSSTPGPTSQPSPVPTVTPTEPASLAPTAAPAATALPGLSKWDAFKPRAVEFAKVGPKISELIQKGAAGDTPTAKEIAQTLKPASDDLATWLDANPPDECYRASWEPLREGARLTSLGAGAYLSGDVTAGSSNLMAGGSKIVEAGSSISDSGDRCRAAG